MVLVCSLKQAAALTIASVTFKAVQAGTGTISATIVGLTQSNGYKVEKTAMVAGAGQVSAMPVAPAEAQTRPAIACLSGMSSAEISMAETIGRSHKSLGCQASSAEDCRQES